MSVNILEGLRSHELASGLQKIMELHLSIQFGNLDFSFLKIKSQAVTNIKRQGNIITSSYAKKIEKQRSWFTRLLWKKLTFNYK